MECSALAGLLHLACLEFKIGSDECVVDIELLRAYLLLIPYPYPYPYPYFVFRISSHLHPHLFRNYTPRISASAASSYICNTYTHTVQPRTNTTQVSIITAFCMYCIVVHLSSYSRSRGPILYYTTLPRLHCMDWIGLDFWIYACVIFCEDARRSDWVFGFLLCNDGDHKFCAVE